jgi:hypothetical protein
VVRVHCGETMVMMVVTAKGTKQTNILSSTCRKDPWRLSGPRKQRVRERLRNVDGVIEAIQKSGVNCSALERALQLPKEGEMLPKDKYTVFSRTARDFRKSVHKVSILSGFCIKS